MCFSKAVEAIVRNGPAHQNLLSLAAQEATRSPWHPQIRTHVCVHMHTHALSLSNSPRCLNLAFPLCQVLTVLSFYFYHVCLLHPPKSDCLGILNPYKEQMSHPVESSFLFKPRMRTVSVMVSFSPSFWLKIHP